MTAYSSIRYDAANSQPYYNYVLNSEFLWNQRGFAGGALGVGVYGYDRWKAGSSGANITYSAPYLTVNSGFILQPIEKPRFPDGCYITISADTGDTDPKVVVAGDSSIFDGDPGVTGKLPHTVYIPPGFTAAGSNLYLYLYPGKYNQVQVTIGKKPPLFQGRLWAEELPMLQRYYQKTYDHAASPGTVTTSGAVICRNSASNTFQVDLYQRVLATMRTTPTVVWYSTNSGTAHMIYRNGGTDFVVSSTSLSSTSAVGYPITTVATVVGDVLFGHWTADSEI